jgi:hypothetical protein
MRKPKTNSSSVGERIDLKVNLKILSEALFPLLTNYPPVERSKAIAGWAIQSTNSSYKDGFSAEFCPYNGPLNKSPHWYPKSAKEMQLPPIQNYTKETEICCTPIKEILAQLNDLGLNPRKARILRLTAGSSSSWHIDGSKKYYHVRLHIPLLTNPGCFFETEYDRQHMPADGSGYLVMVNQNHRVVNSGELDRYHFVVNVWDTKHITQHHQYHPQLNLGESVHP